MERILTLDPGKTTGYVVAICEPGRVRLNYEQQELTEFDLLMQIDRIVPDVIICESFEYRGHYSAKVDLTPCYMIGALRAFLQSKGQYAPDLVMQKPSYGLGGHYGNTQRDRVKALGIYKRGVPHGMDALSHFLQWLHFGEGGKYGKMRELDIKLVPMGELLP